MIKINQFQDSLSLTLVVESPEMSALDTACLFHVAQELQASNSKCTFLCWGDVNGVSVETHQAGCSHLDSS